MKCVTVTAGFGMRPSSELGLFVYANRLAADAELGRDDVTGDFPKLDGSTSRIDAGLRYAPNVDNSVWLDEIVRYRRKEILDRLQHSFGREMIARISFRVG